MKSILKNLHWKKQYFFFLAVLSCGVLSAADYKNQDSSQMGNASFQSAEAVSDGSMAALSMPTFVPVSPLNNKADPAAGLGAVSYAFNIGQCDITAEEYCDFLNHVARAGDPNHLYDSRMSSNSNVASIARNIADDGLVTYAPIKGREAVPIVYVTIYSAARYCNWLQNEQQTIDAMPTVTEVGSYDLTCNCDRLVRLKGAQYFLPTDDEWHKAAYFNPKNSSYYAFPTRSDWSPHNSHSSTTNNNEANYSNGSYSDKQFHLTAVKTFSTSMSPCGAFDMAGDVDQWTESSGSGQRGHYVIKGGSWKSAYYYFGAANDLENSSYRTAQGSSGSPTIGFRIIKLGDSNVAPIALTHTPNRSWLTPTQCEDVGIAAVAAAIIVPCIVIAAPEIAACTAGEAAVGATEGEMDAAVEGGIDTTARRGAGRVGRADSWSRRFTDMMMNKLKPAGQKTPEEAGRWEDARKPVTERIREFQKENPESNPFQQRDAQAKERALEEAQRKAAENK